MITLSDIHRLYRSNEIETTARPSISLTIETGELLAVKSPSGCRKSTLLNILGTIDRLSRRLYCLRTPTSPRS